MEGAGKEGRVWVSGVTQWRWWWWGELVGAQGVLSAQRLVEVGASRAKNVRISVKIIVRIKNGNLFSGRG